MKPTEVTTSAGVGPQSNRERKALQKALRAIGPASEGHMSGRSLCLGVSALIGAAAFGVAVRGSVHKGNAKIDTNVELLCSDQGGLESVGESESGRGLTFRTTEIRDTVKDLEMADRFKDHFGYMVDVVYANAYKSATVTFEVGNPKGGTYQLDGSRPIPLRDVLAIPSCADNMNEKIRGAMEVAKFRVHRNQDR